MARSASSYRGKISFSRGHDPYLGRDGDGVKCVRLGIHSTANHENQILKGAATGMM